MRKCNFRASNFSQLCGFITVLRDRLEYEKMSKRKHEKYRLHEIRVGLDWPSERMKDWELKRNPLRQKMAPVGVEK